MTRERPEIADATRRVWLSAHLMQTWTKQTRPLIRKAYIAAGTSDETGELREALVEAREWFEAAVRSIDSVCGGSDRVSGSPTNKEPRA